MKRFSLLCLLFAVLCFSCNNNSDEKDENNPEMENEKSNTYNDDLSFLKKNDPDLIELKSEDGASRIIISPKYQGKVFTSSADGVGGQSFGWINYKAFEGEPDPHMNAYGGEDRLWLGPEGGPFSLFFQKGAEMVFDNWHTPAAFDSEPWEKEAADDKSTTLSKDMELVNYAGTSLSIQINREISLLSPLEIAGLLNIEIDDNIKSVGFATVNTLTNRGDFEWNKETGAPCMWNLDMFTPSPKGVIVIPYNLNTSGEIATTDYFGQIPADRISFDAGILYFKADGKSRGKLGLPANRSMKISGSYASDAGVLTVTSYDIDSTQIYLNQEWRTDRDPFAGDAANAYNDGPLEDGSQMGPFYEIESVSPAAFLKPGESQIHHHYVFHFTGDKKALNNISQKIFGTTLETIDQKFKN